MRSLLIILGIVLALFLFKTFVLDADKESGNSQKSSSSAKSRTSTKLPVDIYIAHLEEDQNTVNATGTIIPNEEVEIKSEVSGRLRTINIKEGSYIQQGQLIAKLDDSDILAQLKKLTFEEQFASQTKARQRKLLNINAISKEEYDIAVNRVNTLSADKEILLVQLEKTEIKAPFSGRLGFKNISEGAYITPSIVITNLVQSNPVKLDFTMPEKYAQKVKKGNTVTFSMDGNEDVLEGKIIAIDPKIDEGLRTLKVRASAPNSKGILLPGMFIKVQIPLGSESSISIPTESIIPILKGKKVFVVRNGKAAEQIVTTGRRSDTKIQIEKGLSVGDSIIVSALMSVKNGTAITARNVFD